MLAESINALQRLRAESPPAPVEHEADEVTEAETAVLDQPFLDQPAFDRVGTAALLQEPWSAEASALLDTEIPEPIAAQVSNWEHELNLSSLDSHGWIKVLWVLLDRFDYRSDGWRQVAFRLWAGRVLHHANEIDHLDYWQAMSRLEDQVALAYG